MPEPTLLPPQSRPLARPRVAAWRKVLLVLALTAAGLRLVTFHLLNARKHPSAAFPGNPTGPALPAWPLHAGDVLRLTSGDANIAKWAQDPGSTGFVVQLLDARGNPLPTPTFCALEPDYMADTQQPGGALRLVAQQPAGGWSVRWSGGNTVPPFLKGNAHFEANCGTSAIVLMRSDQLHALLDILDGVAMVTPSPAGQPH